MGKQEHINKLKQNKINKLLISEIANKYNIHSSPGVFSTVDNKHRRYALNCKRNQSSDPSQPERVIDGDDPKKFKYQ